jgi:hypothetical protein
MSISPRTGAVLVVTQVIQRISLNNCIWTVHQLNAVFMTWEHAVLIVGQEGTK